MAQMTLRRVRGSKNQGTLYVYVYVYTHINIHVDPKWEGSYYRETHIKDPSYANSHMGTSSELSHDIII